MDEKYKVQSLKFLQSLKLRISNSKQFVISDFRSGRGRLRGVDFFCLVCVYFLFVLPLSAQPAGYKKISDLSSFKKTFATESAKVESITSDFTQHKILTALTEKITSTGNFFFKRSNKVRIDYLKPFTYKMIINGDKLLIKDDKKESRVNVKSNKLFQQVNRIMVDCVQGTILESKDFTTQVHENDKYYLLTMTPVSKMLGEFFQTIVLTVEKKDYAVSSIEMNEPGGDQTVIIFTNKILNKKLPDEVFTL